MYNKQQFVMMELARELLSYDLGDRIDTISSYTKRFDASRGVVQDALNTLEEKMAITRDKRGTLGTFLNHIDYKKLWQISLGRISGVCPLPYTKKHEGLATGIYSEMERKNIPFHFAYMQGAQKRIQGIIEGKYDFAVLSKESATTLIDKYKNISIIMEFEEYSYLSGYALLYKDKDVLKKTKLKVGRDLASPDHTKWMELLAKENNLELEYVDIQYTQMVPAIMDGTIDGTIYNKDTTEKPGIFGEIYYEDLLINADIGDETRAVIVISNKSKGFSNLLNQIIDEEEVNKIQKQVIEGKRDPVY